VTRLVGNAVAERGAWGGRAGGGFGGGGEGSCFQFPTHGSKIWISSSDLRMKWFSTGFDSDPSDFSGV
jgi:hypothetical protein